jgi:hypothetical protein
MPLQALLEEMSHHHFPNPPATPEEIEAFEHRVGWRLDPDLRAFYLHCNGGTLFKRLPNADYHFLPLSEIARARRGPPSMYTLCDLQDGDYILVDVSRQEHGRYPLIDAWHEAWPDPEYCKEVASSFSEFLERALRSGGSWFWLQRSGN